jgi:hypothetical protein
MINLDMKFKIEFLLKTITKNRDKHVKTYKKAYNNYQNLLKQELKNLLTCVENNEDISLVINLKKPVNYENDYNQIISMLENCTDIEMELCTSEYRSIVLDQWNWDDNFAQQTILYSGNVGIGTSLPNGTIEISNQFRN